jgi:hypothetical protein
VKYERAPTHSAHVLSYLLAQTHTGVIALSYDVDQVIIDGALDSGVRYSRKSFASLGQKTVLAA